MVNQLETYRSKRNFRTTAEPRGRRSRASGDSFVIQKHDARRLHYDFRLEMDGVLKSWAVTRGPSLVPGEKRLAVHVEDHPLEYGDFEGTIPKGEYGGGTVLVWDRGTWSPIGDAHKGYSKGHLEFELHGEKLRGRWHLVRMHGKPGEKRENWLLIKGEDGFARPEDATDILEERPESVKTGREVADVAGEAPGWSSKTGRIRKSAKMPAQTAPSVKPEASAGPVHGKAPDPSTVKGAKKARMPDFVPPMLATLVAKAPAGERWLHEIKFDGYRLQARIEAGSVKLLTRSGLDWTEKFGAAVPAALKALPLDSAIIDGELIVETGAGASDFSALQAALSEGRTDHFLFYGFDLLYLDGYDLRGLTLTARKGLLEQIIGTNNDGLIRYSGHFMESGALVLRHACRLSLEGIVSKLRDAPYRDGRSKSWVKSKCSARQEFVIAGYVPSTVSSRAIGSLVLGVYDGDELQHVGRVGTGFTGAIAEDLFRKLESIRIPSSPFTEALTAEERRQVRYVQPTLVAEIEFRAWTADGHLRHASFRGLREDKDAREIIREVPKQAAKAPSSPGRRVKLTHPDRLYWPDEGVTKEGLANYYAEVWRHIAPHLVGRPLALLRCPSGITGEKFFQKHAWKGLNPNIVLIKDPKDVDEQPLISINDLDGLIGLVQSAVLEIHPWGSTVTDWEHPDRIVMDLDPGEGVPWQAVIDAAQEVRQRLTDAGLAAFVKTSGGKGLHVVAPLKPKADWPAVKAFTKALADAMAAEDPDRYVATITKSKRRGKILIDYLRNQRGMTAVAPYSTRARPGAAVSAPIAWEELGPAIGPAYFTVETMPTRLAALTSDPWDGFHRAAAPLETARRGRKKAAGKKTG
ncbi:MULTISPECIES: DNA ligase D [unclassified Chelatococcus]|uniref:DNA ligase D n=1 Tax=unclassified Chelatococcus TaxID=2638111 RepID=UPI001BCB0D9F|nr:MULTISPECIES: DNA ligase D [unclassified Chelatococcus]CAH1657985.1 3'-phosphoesterase / DNA ligase D / DNA repair polymerase [Hyphomicrobiales bacterium]MBS7742233.1 DNA ligase D [Chelatococcus sp. HY11]MBX3542649.1 DNA ligase D [Chelatococcus sp.]MCO5075135.1 DNA ligase D [Chelatococcus sp.]CAH1689497.1 3'-phosphoesterase / DNA ligase D / DNA repair polymerase [Hyphomicrobiales bacterium]